MRNEHTWFGCVIALAAATGAAQSTSTSGTRFGAVVAPAALSAASTAAYVFAGAPEIGAGFRQGLSGLELDVRTLPVDVPVSQEGGYRFRPLLGAGGEVYLGQEISAGLMAQVGADVLKPPLAALRTRFAFAVRLGIGYRFF